MSSPSEQAPSLRANLQPYETWLVSERLMLRPLHWADYEQYKGLIERNTKWLERWQPPTRVDSHRFQRRIQRELLNRLGKKGFRFGVFLNDSNKLVGEVDLYDPNWHTGFRTITADAWVGEEAIRQGVGTEAISMGLTYAFKHLGIHRVISTANVNDQATDRLMWRVGMRREGRFKSSAQFGNPPSWHDHNAYAVLDAEFSPVQCEVLDVPVEDPVVLKALDPGVDLSAGFSLSNGAPVISSS